MSRVCSALGPSQPALNSWSFTSECREPWVASLAPGCCAHGPVTWGRVMVRARAQGRSRDAGRNPSYARFSLPTMAEPPGSAAETELSRCSPLSPGQCSRGSTAPALGPEVKPALSSPSRPSLTVISRASVPGPGQAAARAHHGEVIKCSCRAERTFPGQRLPGRGQGRDEVIRKLQGNAHP